MTEANLQHPRGLPTSLTNKRTVFIVWQSLCTIPEKKKQLYTYLATLVQLALVQLSLVQRSLVAKFAQVCTQFEEKAAIHLPTCK